MSASMSVAGSVADGVASSSPSCGEVVSAFSSWSDAGGGREDGEAASAAAAAVAVVAAVPSPVGPLSVAAKASSNLFIGLF